MARGSDPRRKTYGSSRTSATSLSQQKRCYCTYAKRACRFSSIVAKNSSVVW